MSDAPQRIQRSRATGWRMPPGAVYVGRPTKWGNPYRVGETFFEPRSGLPSGPADPRVWRVIRVRDRTHATELYREFALLRLGSSCPDAAINLAEIEELRGRDLVCWCPLDQPCHADVLLELANR